jgi:uncharacterized membrane protein YphA (DoxX/SURF4 family)
MSASDATPRPSSAMTYLLWTIQVLLAALFLFAGSVKLAVPIEEMAQQTGMPGLFLRFIGVCEVLGGLGLVLPGLLRIATFLTPLAASGLVIIMIGATAVTVATTGVAMAAVPFVTGVLAAFVAYGRWRLAPYRERVARGSMAS